MTVTGDAPYNPPLTLRGEAWRFVIVLGVSSLAWAGTFRAQWGHHPLLWVLDLVLGLAGFALMFLRRRSPLLIAVLVNALLLGSAFATGPATLVTVSLATRRVVWQIVLVGALAMVAAQGYADTQPSTRGRSWLGTFFVTVVVNVAILLWGMYIGSRRELLWSLRERARQAEEQQELRIATARAGERERIAREMHDVLAHRISLVAMHAGALSYRGDLPPDQVRETAKVIQAKAHEALADLREVLGTLRDGDTATKPQPTLGDLPALVQEAVDGGTRVDLAIDVEDQPDMPATLGRTVFRIVQEGLTNARKHAEGASVVVDVHGGPTDGVVIRVRNLIPVGHPGLLAPGAGLGLVGLRERAELAGGTLQTTSDRDGFELRGWLPWTT